MSVAKLLAALVLVTVAGCTGGPADEAIGTAPTAAPTTGTPTTTPPATTSPAPTPAVTTPEPAPTTEPPTDDYPSSAYGYRDVCAGVRFASAPRYAGAHHPMVISALDRDNPRDPLDDDLSDGVRTDRTGRWVTEDVTKVQLVACVTLTQGPLIQRCRYNFGYVARLYSADVAVVFRETRTARVVGTARARGRDATCQDAIAGNDNGTADHQYSDLTQAQSDGLFGPFALGPPR